MDSTTFWSVIDQARTTATPTDCCTIATTAATLLATYPPGEIVAAQQLLWDLLADSYTSPLWSAAYLMNSGCSDDGFDYFRGWLLTQGRTAFETAIATPDSLASLPAVQQAAESGQELECEEALSIAWTAHQTATGMKLPDDAFTIRYPDLDESWDIEDMDEVATRLPRLGALFEA